MTERFLKEKGEFDYDYVHDILFFKLKNREYDRSIEIDTMVIDIDKENFVVGVQLFGASEFLRVKKAFLMNIPKWELCTKISENRLELRLTFQVKIRNKIVEKNPIILERIKDSLPDSEMMCVAA